MHDTHPTHSLLDALRTVASSADPAHIPASDSSETGSAEPTPPVVLDADEATRLDREVDRIAEAVLHVDREGSATTDRS